MKSLIAAAVLGLFTLGAQAQMSPVGLWKTIDDDGKTAKSLVRISDNGGVLTGKIEKIFDPAKADAICDVCKDDRKNQPVVGLQIIRGAKQDADDKSIWTGGEILDPNNGKTYKNRLRPIEGGKKLEMRGYIGFFYRTQVWERVE
ncbi:uncharacterized protein (DUF2147 family) [Inhella inkyongensis]|uniref:Uncharacterized protein (DUF2147 family) n=1 Tax=Inhella inkyongensis TaxID=392593 RepID=A0A840S2U5_9BURK|nr:DUF2147 domain-containing protein [Inhella inkyongensis]MBB5203406.1 uncharacterized protein (DUF2147 family) [Inhella inkyongensis]